MDPRLNSRPEERKPCTLATFAEDESGVTAVEYGLVAALIAMACIGAFTAYADALNAVYQAWVVPALEAILGALGG
jgi:pilus assembly protein Flp/PilA